jgi:tRNA (mo5U34)-methyltransferase
MPKEAVFDTVFSMGVLYHQKDPLLHLQQLKTLLIDEGELILETLIVSKLKKKMFLRFISLAKVTKCPFKTIAFEE